MQRIRVLVTILLFGTLVAGCAKGPPKEARLPEGRRTRGAIALERELLRIKDGTANLKGLAWVELKTPDEDWRTEAAMVLKRPNRVRMDAMDSLADVWAQLGSDGKTLWLYIPGKNKLYKGRASSRNMKRLISFEWQPEEFISAIAGAPLTVEEPQIVQLQTGGSPHFYDLATRLHIWTEDGKKKRISRCVRYAKGGDDVEYEIRFSDYKRTRGISFPYHIEALFPSRGASIKVEYRDLELGEEVGSDIFTPPVRARGKTVKIK